MLRACVIDSDESWDNRQGNSNKGQEFHAYEISSGQSEVRFKT